MWNTAYSMAKSFVQDNPDYLHPAYSIIEEYEAKLKEKALVTPNDVPVGVQTFDKTMINEQQITNLKNTTSTRIQPN